MVIYKGNLKTSKSAYKNKWFTVDGNSYTAKPTLGATIIDRFDPKQYSLVNYELVENTSALLEAIKKEANELISKKHIEYQESTFTITTTDNDGVEVSFKCNSTDETTSNLLKSYTASINEVCYLKVYELTTSQYKGLYIAVNIFESDVYSVVEEKVRVGFDKKAVYQNNVLSATTVAEVQEVIDSVNYEEAD